MAIDHNKKQQDARELAHTLLGNPAMVGLNLNTQAAREIQADAIAKFCHLLAYKLQDES